MSLIVNLAKRTVQGFDVPARVTIVDDMTVTFGERREDGDFLESIIVISIASPAARELR
jgi:hypothetical protein